MKPNFTVILTTWKHATPSDRRFFIEKAGFASEEEFLTFMKMNIDIQKSQGARDVDYPEYVYQQNLMLFIPPILLLIGIFGNLISFAILRKRLLSKQSTYLYLAVLAIFDTGVLVVGLLGHWITALTEFNVVNTSDWMCKFAQFFGYFFSDVSVWLIVIVTTERYIVVCKPLKTLYVCNLRRAKIILAVLISMLAIVNTHFFWTVQVVVPVKNSTGRVQCAGHGRYKTLVDDIWPWVDALIYSFIPFVLITYFNCVIIYRVSEARKSRDTLQNNSATCKCISEGRDAFKKSETKVTVTLLSISIAFLITALPLNVYIIAAAVYNTYHNLDGKIRAKFELADTLTTLLMYTNHSINFFLYCATGEKFRRQLLRMLCAGRFVNNNAAQPVKFTMIKTNLSDERQRAIEMQTKTKQRVTFETYYH